MHYHFFYYLELVTVMAFDVTLSKIREAIIDNDVEKIFSLYTDDENWHKYNPSQPLGNGSILLHLACYYGRYEIVNYFIDSQLCDINCRDSKKRNALHHLSQPYSFHLEDKRVKIAKVLLEMNCDINAQDTEGNTPIHRAITNHDLGILRIFLEKKDHVKLVQNADGDTPLHIACVAGLDRFVRKEVVKSLLEVYPRYLDTFNKNGYSPLFVACTSNVTFYLEELSTVVGGNLQQRAEFNKYTLLHLAVHADKLCIVEWLMSQYDSQWFQYCIDSDGKTPMHLVQSKECLDALLSGGYDVNIPDSYGNTLLHLIASDANYSSSPFKQIELLQYLLSLESCKVSHQNMLSDAPLHLAAQSGDALIVERFLSSDHCDTNVKNGKGETILHLAVKFEHKELTEFLLSHDRVNVDSIDDSHATAVHSAASTAPPDILSCFKNFTGSFDKEGRNAFHVAVCKRELSIIKQIVSESDPDLSIPTEQGDTILHLAARYSNVQVLEFLLGQKSVDINATDRNLDTCLHIAVNHSKLEIVEFLFGYRGCVSNLMNIHGLSPLSIAAHSRNLEILHHALLTGRVDCYALPCTRQNDTILHLAAQCNSMETVKVCLSLGFDINSVNSNLETPFFIAVKYRNLDIVNYLASVAGCKLDVRNKDGNSALHEAVLSNHIDCTQALVSLQCNVNLKNHEGFSPLHSAIRLGEGRCDDILHCLTSSHDCNHSLKTRDGDNILHLAASVNCVAVFHYLSSPVCESLVQSTNATGDYPLHVAVELSQLEFVKHALSLPYNIPNHDCLRAFHAAIKHSDINIIKAFIEAKEDVLFSSTTNALHLAASEGNMVVFQSLLDQNVSHRMINSRDEAGQTPLHIAIRQGCVDIAECLIRTKKCELTLPDNAGNTPLHLVCMMKNNQQGSLKISKLLLRKCKASCTDCANKDGKTPSELVEDNYKFLHAMFRNVAAVTARNPLEHIMKIIVVGKSAVGKSSFIKAITTEAKYRIWKKNRLVTDVSKQTAGIETRPFISQRFGRTKFYEFAGHLEYYSSNAAILENLMSHSPPVFVVVVSLKNSDDDILNDLFYWWHFISTPCQKSTASPVPHAIVALSHLDVFQRRGRKIGVFKNWLLHKMEEKFPSSHFEFRQRICFLDCRKVFSSGLRRLQSYLKESCGALGVKLDVDLACHYLTEFLRDHFKENLAIQLHDIQTQVQEDSFIHKDPQELLKLLETLHHQDQILLLKSQVKVEDSWVVLQKDTLLSKVNGSFFSKFQDQRQLAYSTGVVPFENIKIYLKQYDPFMIIGFFSHLEFCSLIEDAKAYSLIQNDHPSLTHRDQRYYFFPCFIRAYPLVSELWMTPTPHDHVKYGWFYEADQHELQTRFLHVLLLRIAFQFALKDLSNVQTPVLNRRCSVWKNGIAWLKDGFHVIVEIGLQKNWISVIIQCENELDIRVQCTRVLSELTQTIRDARKEFCPSSDMLEYFIDPEHVDYPMEGKVTDEQTSLILYETTDAVRSILASKTGHITDRAGRNSKQLCRLVPFEPLIYCGKSLTRKIFSQSPRTQSLDQLKNEMIDNAMSHNEQIELIKHFFLQCKKDGLQQDSSDSSEQFKDYIVQHSILSHIILSFDVRKSSQFTSVVNIMSMLFFT